LAEHRLANLKHEVADFQPGADSDASLHMTASRWLNIQKLAWKPSTLKQRE
jgi:hypothetical protein